MKLLEKLDFNMRGIEFKKVLFKAAFVVMACDGEVHQSEVDEIHAIANDELYFDGLDIDKELKALLSELKDKGHDLVNQFFELINNTKFSDLQEFQMLEVVLRIIEADDKIDDNEVNFLQQMKKCLDVSDITLITKFPRHVDILVNVDIEEALSQSTKIDTIDISEVEGFLDSKDE